MSWCCEICEYDNPDSASVCGNCGDAPAELEKEDQDTLKKNVEPQGQKKEDDG